MAKLQGERDERRIAVYSNPQTVVKEGFITVLHGLTKDLDLWGAHTKSLFSSRNEHFLLFMLEIPCVSEYFSNNKSIMLMDKGLHIPTPV